MTDIHFTIVPNEYGTCPRCGAYWGHPDKSLDFPNRQKVDNHWRCYNPACTAGYYDPETQEVVEDKPSPEQAKASALRIKAEVEAMMEGQEWVQEPDNGSGIQSFRLQPKD